MAGNETKGPTGTSGSAGGKVNPGDDAAPGTPGTGENICPKCQGTGRLQGSECPECAGTGKVVEGLAGG